MKFNQTLEFKLIVVITPLITLVALVMGLIAFNISTKNVTKSLDDYMYSTTESATGKIKGKMEKQLRLLSGVAELDVFQDPATTLFDKCVTLRQVAAVSDEYENIA